MKRIVTFCFAILMLAQLSIAQGRATFQLLETEYPLMFSAISPNGKYAVGMTGTPGSTYLWSEEEGLELIGEGIIPMGISDNKIISGEFYVETSESEYVAIPGYWKDGEIFYLDEQGIGGGISGDGTHIGGGIYINGDLKPAVWENATPTTLSEVETGRVYKLSYDGTVAGGWFSNYGSSRFPLLWNKNEGYSYITHQGTALHIGEVQSVSANGRYAGISAKDEAAFYDIVNKRLVKMGVMNEQTFLTLPTGISDDGIMTGESQMYGGAVGFVFTEDLGIKDLYFYLVENLGVELPSDILPYPMHCAYISRDGKRIVGYATVTDYNTYDQSVQSFIIDIDEHFIPTRPKGLQATETAPLNISLKWEPVEATEGKELVGYNIYKAKYGEWYPELAVKVNTTPVTDTNYIDIWEEAASVNYTVKAVWSDDTESEDSNEVRVSSALVSVPFIDGFDYNNTLNASLWNSYYEGTIVSDFPRWVLNTASGIDIPCVSYTVPSAGGVYDESFTSAYIDATNCEKVLLTFNLSLIANDANGGEDYLDVEVFDGTEWQQVRQYTLSIEYQTGFVYEAIDLTDIAVGKQIRVRFRAHGDNKNGNVTWFIDNFSIAEDKIETVVPLNLNAFRKDNGEVYLSWTDGNEAARLSYLQSETPVNAVGNEGIPVIFANKFDEDDLKYYDGYKLTSISAYLTRVILTEEEEEIYGKITPAYYRVVAFKGTQRVLNRMLYPEDYKENSWNTFELEEPIVIDASQPFYYGIELVIHHPVDLPMGISNTTEVDGKSNLYSEDNGFTWRSIYQDFNLRLSYALKAIIIKDPEMEPVAGTYGYKIYRDGVELLGANQLTGRNNYIDTTADPTKEHCYEVAAWFITQQESEKSTRVCVEGQIVNIDREQENELLVYPNPVTDYIYINGEIVEVKLTDMQGKVILRSTESIIDVQSLPSAIYLLEITTNEGVINKKVIKK